MEKISIEMGSSPRTAAADLIRSIDNAFAEINSLSVDAAREAEEARSNARIASELARRYRAGSSLRDGEGGAFSFHPGSSPYYLDSLVANGSDLYGHNNANGRIPDSDTDSLRKRKNGSAAADRLAKSHAEDVLSLSLELERVKRSLEAEEMAHDVTKSAMAQTKARNTQLETQIEKLLNDMETQREGNGRTVDDMEHELDRARMRVDLAEEDAELALDLAKTNAESREQLEEWLGKALEELEVLREHGGAPIASGISREEGSAQSTKPKHAVHFADSPSFFSEPSPTNSATGSPANRPARSMVSAGRKILQRSLGAGSDEDPGQNSVSVSPSKSAERRRRLRDRLKTSDEQNKNPKPSFLDHAGLATDQNGQVPPKKTTDACRNAARILKQSGERLSLSGRWWGETSDDESDGVHLETLARHYCTSVEVSKLSLVTLWMRAYFGRHTHHTFRSFAGTT
jgi:hypothetical protein